MDDAKIAPLHEAATKYAGIRDRRQLLTTEEVECKSDLLKLMKKHEKTHYEHDGVVVDLVVEEETVKVKIKKPKDDDDE
jgi:hypothetical protein